MLNIFANSFMTATRTNTVKGRDVATQDAQPKRRWLPNGHWWVQPYREMDLDNL